MSESKEKRVLQLEQYRTVADQKKEYCGCRCHWKYIEDFMEISDEKCIAVAEIVESFGSFRLPDGSYKKYSDDLLERNAKPIQCTCKCNH